MVSEKQLEANRRNAQLSTGPRTPEGKAAVSLNSLTHGLRARRTVLPGENEEDFYHLCADLEADWQPETRTEQILLEEMAVAHWKLARVESLEGQIMREPPGNKERMALLVQIFQQQSRLKNSFLKSMHELQRLQKSRAVQPDQPAPAATEPVANLRPIAVPPQETAYRAASVDEPPTESASSAFILLVPLGTLGASALDS